MCVGKTTWSRYQCSTPGSLRSSLKSLPICSSLDCLSSQSGTTTFSSSRSSSSAAAAAASAAAVAAARSAGSSLAGDAGADGGAALAFCPLMVPPACLTHSS